MEDVKTNDSEQPVEAPTEQGTQPVEQTETPEVPETPEEPIVRQVPLSELLDERKKRQELARELAEAKVGNQVLPNPDVMQDPFVQELILKDAKRELIDHTRDLLDKYPTIPEAVKKAILRNPRGYVNETTTDLETAKLDIAEYVETIAAETQPPAVQKGFPVAATNLPSTESSKANPNEVQKILDKPIDEWTKEEEATVGEFSKKSK
jgi:hypothetical protein